MKINYNLILFYFCFFILFFPVDICFLEDTLQEDNETTNNLKYYIGGLIIIVLITGFFYYGDNSAFSNFEPEIEFRPPRRIEDFNPPRCPIYQIQQTILK